MVLAGRAIGVAIGFEERLFIVVMHVAFNKLCNGVDVRINLIDLLLQNYVLLGQLRDALPKSHYLLVVPFLQLESIGLQFANYHILLLHDLLQLIYLCH